MFYPKTQHFKKTTLYINNFKDDGKVSSHSYKRNHVLMKLAETQDLTLLKHPLVLRLLALKWENSVKYSYWTGLIVYVAYVLTLTMYSFFLPPPYNLDASNEKLMECPVYLANVINRTKSSEKWGETWEKMPHYHNLIDEDCNVWGVVNFYSMLNSIRVFLVILALARFANELKGMWFYGADYFKDGSNYRAG